MGYHIYAIGKAIRALFADRVTYINPGAVSVVVIQIHEAIIYAPIIEHYAFEQYSKIIYYVA